MKPVGSLPQPQQPVISHSISLRSILKLFSHLSPDITKHLNIQLQWKICYIL